MAKKRITTDLVEALKPGDVVFDTQVRGFFVRYRGGVARYGLKAIIRGRQTILTIGAHSRGEYSPERARREAERLRGLIRDGKDPAADRAADKGAPTLAGFAARYMTEYSEGRKKPRTVAEDARLLRLYILPTLGKAKLRDLGRAEVARFHARMRGTPIAANRALALLSAMLGWAEKVGERDDGSNPCRHVDRYPENARERLLTAEELGRLGDVLGQAEALGLSDWRPVAVVRLLLFSGARLSEVLGLRWEWLNLETGIVRLPDSKTGAKNLILPAPALELLTGLPRFADNEHVIPGDRAGAAFVGIQKAWQRIRAAAGLGDVHLHDLRHAFASTAVAAGDSLYIVGKLLGHKQATTTQRYSHLAPDPAKAVADRTANRLRAIMEGGAGEVVPLRPTGGRTQSTQRTKPHRTG